MHERGSCRLSSFGLITKDCGANAVVTISDVELAHKIRKGQFNTEQLTSSVKVRVSQMWEAVPAA
jgi:hypothetical protein